MLLIHGQHFSKAIVELVEVPEISAVICFHAHLNIEQSLPIRYMKPHGANHQHIAIIGGTSSNMYEFGLNTPHIETSTSPPTPTRAASKLTVWD